jgi:tetratricopeptide (TPR) repeat protein
MLDHYVHSAYGMDRVLGPHRDPITPALGDHACGVTPEQPADIAGAMAWFATERPILLAAVRHACDTGQDAKAWQLAWALTTYLSRRGPWHDLHEAWRTALHAAERLDDSAMRAGAHRELAHTHTESGRYEDARLEHKRALDLYTEVGDHAGRAETHRRLATVCEREGRLEQSLEHTRQSLTLYQKAAHRSGEASAMNGLGWFHALLGDHAQALAHCEDALAMLSGLGDRQGEADTWDSLGYIHGQRGDHDEAIACYRRALDLYRSLGDRFHEAATLVRLGETYQAGARCVWQESLDTLTDLEHWMADAVRRRLAHLSDEAETQAWLPRPTEPVATAGNAARSM